jgi:hypothetical protein
MPEFEPGRFGIVGPDGYLHLDRDGAAKLERIRLETLRLGRMSLQPPLQVSDGPSGRSFSISGIRSIVGILSGSTSPYTFTEVAWNGTAWVTLTGGATGNAYEYNAVAGLGGKVTKLDFKEESNDWRFQWIKRGGCTCSLNTIGNVSGCSLTTPNVSLSGISSSGGGTITVAATSSNTSVVATPTVTYTSPNATGTLHLNILTPSGSSTISVTVSSTACGPITRTFTVTSGANITATLDPISNQTFNPLVTNPGVVNLTGIGPGAGGGTGHIGITANTTSSAAVLSVTPSYTNPNTTGTVSIAFTGFADTVTLTVTVNDSNPAYCGKPITRTATITIT